MEDCLLSDLWRENTFTYHHDFNYCFKKIAIPSTFSKGAVHTLYNIYLFLCIIFTGRLVKELRLLFVQITWTLNNVFSFTEKVTLTAQLRQWQSKFLKGNMKKTAQCWRWQKLVQTFGRLPILKVRLCSAKLNPHKTGVKHILKVKTQPINEVSEVWNIITCSISL